MVHCRPACALPGEQVTICLCRGPRIQVGALGLQNKPGLSLMEHTSQPGETLRFSHKLAEEYLKKKVSLLCNWPRGDTRPGTPAFPHERSGLHNQPAQAQPDRGKGTQICCLLVNLWLFQTLPLERLGRLLALTLHYLQMALKRKKNPRQSRPGAPQPLIGLPAPTTVTRTPWRVTFQSDSSAIKWV